jgi:hypothetical protein
MRAAFTFVAASFVAACSPDVAPGTYLCGPEELCPDGLVCNGPDNICVSPSAQQAFDCGKFSDVPGDDAPATAQDLGELTCVSLVREKRGCLPFGDSGDFYTFTVSSNCTNVRVKASVVYPVAFQSLALQVGKQGETPATVDSPCTGFRAPDEADAVSCLDAPVGPGTYTLSVIPDGAGNCDGNCRFNRYGLAVQVTTP